MFLYELYHFAIHLLNFKVSNSEMYIFGKNQNLNSPKHQLNFKVPNFRQILAKLGEIMLSFP